MRDVYQRFVRARRQSASPKKAAKTAANPAYVADPE
jgi:hypothetical protein